jgi:excisionase family DNA binding protein
MNHPVRNYGSIEQAAEIYGVDKRTVRRWIADGSVTGYRMGPRLIRVDLNEVNAKMLRPIPAGGTAATAEVG